MAEASSDITEYFDELLKKSSEFAVIVAEEIGNLSANTERRKVAILLLASALSHYRAINFLLDDGRNIESASALVRSVADASFRAIWIAKIASDKEVFAAFESDDAKWPNPKKITECLQSLLNQKVPGELEIIQRLWGNLSGFIHTGSKQLQNIMRYHSLGYPDAIRVRIITGSSLYLSYGACIAASSFDALGAATRMDGEFEALYEFGEEILRPTKSTVN
jgi:hypothetical protein